MDESGYSRVLRKIPLLIACCVFISGCLEFKSIEQPSSVVAGETFTVFVEATQITSGRAPQPYFGICLPQGWTVSGDVVACTGIYNEYIIYDPNLALEQEALSPAPEGYYWWVGDGNVVSDGNSTETDFDESSAVGEVHIQTDNRTGRFSLDYMLGTSPYDVPNPGAVTISLSNGGVNPQSSSDGELNLQESTSGGLNLRRSDDHIIHVVDKYTPREMQAVVEGGTVTLSWIAPPTSEGLIGYDVYRDEQIINTSLAEDNVYVDNNPPQELVCYTVSSLYDNDDVHFMPYEIKVLVFPEGTGDPNDPYRIATVEQLVSFSITDFPHLLDECFVLINNIDLDPNLPGGQVFDRGIIAHKVSVLDNTFTGAFDGNGHIISNLHIQGSEYLGLFGQLGSGARISNLGLEAVDVNGIRRVAGLVGYNYGGRITTSYSTGTVSGEDNVGGLVGWNYGNIVASYSTGTVTGYEGVGGLVGDNRGGITTSYSTDTVSGDRRIGGLVGSNSGSNCSITMSYSTGTVSGDRSVGGLVGSNGSRITTSYSSATVSGDRYVGGLVGYCRGPIVRTYSTGMVTGNEDVGGLVGYSGSHTTWNSFWDIETSGQDFSDGGTGKTTAEMQTAHTFLEAWWDFVGEDEVGTDDIWWILEGQDYPRLWWEAVE